MGSDPMDASNKMTFVVSPGDGSAAKARCCRGRDSLPLWVTDCASAGGFYGIIHRNGARSPCNCCKETT